MPVKKKKKFIDKKNAVSFHLVHRSQRDPLQASDEASQRVLLPVETKEDEKRREEQIEYGIFFDDDYDYMQHLRDVDEAYELEPVDRFKIVGQQINKQDPKIQLPSSVFASDVETDVGLLNQAVPIRGPQPNWDPDIVEALDEDFDFENPDNQLDDDFFVKANAPVPECEMDDVDGSDDDFASDEADMSDGGGGIDDCYGDQMFMDEETKSRFTNYSMSSSVIRRNEGLSLLDDRFEKLYEQYDDTEIGALDHEDIDGNVHQGSHMLDTILEEFEKQQEEKKLKDVVDENEQNVVEDDDGDSDEGNLVKLVIEEPKERWDCESILSTYSNLYNHPKLIEEPKKERQINLTSKAGIPEDVISRPGLTRKQIEQEMRANLRADRASTYRPKDETVDEKKSRKLAVKEERRQRREEKKSNKQAFGKEKLRQEKEKLNIVNNLQGIKIS